ncbi:MAG TPA: response regulator [Candidatus Saccharimonadales bacterium]|nr:response regulator [Candidatus Saccharimonadales bacterium]
MNHRILVIDDNAAIHDDIRKILARPKSGSASFEDQDALLFGKPTETSNSASFEIDSALQGQEGLELVRKSLEADQPYALAFVDVRMPPGWDGVETIARIWQIYPELQVVICTAYSDYSWEDITRKFGHSDNVLILKKPFDNIEVLQMAHALTKKWFLTQQAKSQLINLEERFTKAFKSSPVPMSIQSLENYNYLDVNDSYLEMTGYSREELIGKSAWQLELWPDQQKRRLLLEQLNDGHSLRNVETKVRTKEGREKRTLLSAELTTLENKRFALISENDISQRLELEAQLRQAQKMEAVGHLAAGVAHDFRNILTVIQGHACLRLLNPDLDAKTSDSLKQITESVERASNLTQQLLAFSRKQIMRLEVVNVNNLLRHVSDMLARVIGDHITLQYQFGEPLPCTEADVCSIEQVILNLAVNARDAMPQGGSLVIASSVEQVSPAYASSHPEANAGEFVCITVTDTGCGMNEQTKGRLFEPFFTTKEVGKGTGMGLATAYGLIKQHNGWIEAESELGKGSTFKIYLPSSAKQLKLQEPAVSSRQAEGGNETILVVEDEELVREFVASLLVESGYKVRQAGNGVEALEVWRNYSTEIDLLLTDVVMPQKISGIELADKLRVEKSDLKVIFTSGYSLELLDEHFRTRTESNFIPKPYTPAKLKELIREVLDR